MTRILMRFPRFACVFLLVCVLLSCGLTAFAAEEGSTDVPATELMPPEATAAPEAPQAEPPAAVKPTPPPEVIPKELFPADVQTIIEDSGRRIVKTYILSDGDNPADIPRDSFTRDGWHYTLTDITQKKTSVTEKKPHTEVVEINTDTKDISVIITQLAPTLEYQSEDGYSGVLTLDLASVNCEAVGYKNSNYTVTATREYPHLSTNDLSLIPKSIMDNGRTLELDGVTWEAQHTVNVDYYEIPDCYRAVAVYTAKASQSVVTGYITTADYTGEVERMAAGDAVYTALFIGSEINPAPKPPVTPEPAETPAPVKDGNSAPLLPIMVGVAVIAALLGGAAVFYFLRHNVKVYEVRESGYVLVAKVRISAKNPTIDLTPLTGHGEKVYSLEIDRLAAKALNGRAVEVVYGPVRLQHIIAYEGNTYKIEADFNKMSVKAIY